MSFYITTDSGCDLPKSYKKDHFVVFPIYYTLDNVEYDGYKKYVSLETFYSKMRNGSVPVTSLINTYNATEYLRDVLKEGKDVLHLCFSSGLSGTYNSFLEAVEVLRKEFPNNKIILVDTRNASLGHGLLVDYCIKKRDDGATIEQVEEYALYLQENLNSYFTVEDLKYLMRSGRTTKMKAFISTLANIKPILHVSPEGKLTPVEKEMGRKKSILNLASQVARKITSKEENEIIFISHAMADEREIDLLKKKVTELTGVDNFFVSYIGPVIGAHSGPGTIAIFFIGKGKKYDK